MNKYDSLLCLKSPKLLTNIIAYTSKNEYDLSIVPIVEKDETYSIKSEKTHKVYYEEADFIAGKKNKNKTKKKVKQTFHVEKSISQIGADLDFSDINKKVLVRSSKNFKVKASNKEKNQAIKSNLSIKEANSKDIYLDSLFTVDELAIKLSVPPADIIKWLFLQGISVTINQLLDISISTLVAKHYSFNILKKSDLKTNIQEVNLKKQKGDLRAPIITLLGHVDHGKTSLLQAIRQDNSLIREAGNITQSIGSYEVTLRKTEYIDKLIFLDTPGHEAFISMRERGANITDIAVLVVAADDGLKPQTIEAINHIRNKNLPFIVAINKIDKPEANIEKVEKELREFNIKNDTASQNTTIIKVSSLKKQNIDKLLESLIYISQKYQWRSDTTQVAEGTILEAYLDKQKGPVVQVLIKNGTLSIGDIIVAGNLYGKVKAIENNLKENVPDIESAALAHVLCFTEVPIVGLSFKVVKNEKQAKKLAAEYTNNNTHKGLLNSRISLDDIEKQGGKTIVKQINLIIKTSTRGAIDAIIYTLSEVPQEKIQINLLLADCGEVSFKDIDLATTSNSVVLAFGLNISTTIAQYAESKNILFAKFQVIYDLVEYVKEYMLQFIEVEYSKNVLGYGQVKDLFIVNKSVVAGCLVQSGKLKKDAFFKLTRTEKKIYEGVINSLKRMKDDVSEVNEGHECGVLSKDYSLWRVGDYLECYELEPLEKTL